MTRDYLQQQSLERLRDIAKQQNVKSITRYRKSELIDIILNGGIVPNSAADKERAAMLAALLPELNADEAQQESGYMPTAAINAQAAAAEAKAAEADKPAKKRGRPRKQEAKQEEPQNDSAEPSSPAEALSAEAEVPSEAAEKPAAKKRGRPRKEAANDDKDNAPIATEDAAEPAPQVEKQPSEERAPLPRQEDKRTQQYARPQYQRNDYQPRADYSRQEQDYTRARYDRSDRTQNYPNQNRDYSGGQRYALGGQNRYYNDRNDYRQYQNRDYQPARDYSRDYRDYTRDMRDTRDPRDTRDTRESRDYQMGKDMPRYAEGYDYPREGEEQARFAQREQGYYNAEYGTSNPAVPEMLEAGDCGDAEGVLEIVNEGFGFLRCENYLPSSRDVYISNAQIRRFRLKTGDLVTGKTRPTRETDKYSALLYITAVNGMAPEEMLHRRPFEELVPIYPEERFTLESPEAKGSESVAIRLIDLMAPIGKGQRGLIVSQPKAGKTTLLKNIANGISNNYPDVHLIVLLIDERPEEVTDMQRSIKGEVVYSTFDELPERHTRVAEMVLERSMRLVELGKDVVVLMDSITRLARAYNITINTSGKTLSGGMDPGALYKPKRFFGAARNIENGGSLTVLATALVETGSRMDDMVYEEFKGTGNMEIHLDRKLSERRIFPAIDIYRSGTRRDELLLTKPEMECATAVRRMLSSGNAAEIAEDVVSMFAKSENNEEFMNDVNRRISRYESQGFSVGRNIKR